MVTPTLHQWRVNYRAVRGDALQAATLHAATATEAVDLLRKEHAAKGRSIWSIGRISILCEGTKQDGTRCTRWSDDYLCPSHRMK